MPMTAISTKCKIEKWHLVFGFQKNLIFFIQSVIYFCTKKVFLRNLKNLHQGLRAPNKAFFLQNPKLFGLGRQLGQISFGAFGKVVLVLRKVAWADSSVGFVITQCTEVRFASFFSGGFTTMAVMNPPEKKLEKRTSVQWSAHATLRITRTTLAFGLFSADSAPNLVLWVPCPYFPFGIGNWIWNAKN